MDLILVRLIITLVYTLLAFSSWYKLKHKAFLFYFFSGFLVFLLRICIFFNVIRFKDIIYEVVITFQTIVLFFAVYYTWITLREHL